jgi:hypothetical protein
MPQILEAKYFKIKCHTVAKSYQKLRNICTWTENDDGLENFKEMEKKSAKRNLKKFISNMP